MDDDEADFQNHPLREAFCEWGAEEGVDGYGYDHWEDVKAWWECFLAGARAALSKIKT